MSKSTRVSTIIGSGPLAAQAPRRSLRVVRLVAGLLIIGALGANVAAASLGISGQQTLGVGLQDVTACDTDGFAVVPVSEYVSTSTAFVARAINLGGTTATSARAMSSACVGKTMTLVILTSNADGSGTTTVPAAAIPSSAAGNGGWSLVLPTPLLSEDIAKVVIQIED